MAHAGPRRENRVYVYVSFFSPWALESCLVTCWFLVFFAVEDVEHVPNLEFDFYIAKTAERKSWSSGKSIHCKSKQPGPAFRRFLNILTQIWTLKPADLAEVQVWTFFFAILVLKRLRLLCVFLLMVVMGVIIAFRIEPQTYKVEKNNDDIKPFMCPLTSAKCFW